MKKVFFLKHEVARKNAASFCLTAQDGMMVVFSEPARNNEQNAKMHAIISDISKQYEHCGRKWDAEDMKRLLLHAFRIDTVKDPELEQDWQDMRHIDIVPSLDGESTVLLGVQSRSFSVKLASAFIEWLTAFAAENKINLTY